MKLLRIEITKSYKRKNIKVLVSLYMSMLILMSILYLVAEKRLGLTLYTEGQFITSSLSLVMAGFMPLLALYVASVTLSSEMSSGTLKNMLLLPIKREQLYLSKIAAVLSLIGGMLILQWLYSMVFSIIVDGAINFSFLIGTLGDYFGAFLVLGLIINLSIALTLAFKSTGITIVSSYLLYVILGFVGIYFPAFSNVNPTTIFREYGYFFEGGGGIQLLSTFAYYIIIVMTGLLLFDKKEEEICLYD
ncbi:MAG: ABC transporter permease [Clostridiales bacterium]|nr:ABC transporter permease [Clostridiales bacterium]